jgi:predicted nucleic acid-binding protein
MNDKFFVDTNVLVYSRDISEPGKQKQALDWMTHLWETGSGRLSFQVLQEFYVTVTEKLKPGLPPTAARSDVRSLWAWDPVPLDARVLDGAWAIQDRYRLSWWDSLIVSAAQVTECRYLLTEDLQETQEFGKVKIVNPFGASPESLLGVESD